MRVLVLGAAGMLGHRVWRELSEHVDAYAAVRHPYARYAALAWFIESRVVDCVDVTSDDDLERAFDVAQPDVVINAVGIVKQRQDASDAVQSITINALLPHRLVTLCSAAGARLIHVSTDCVYSGDRGRYVETDLHDAREIGRASCRERVSSVV